MNNQPVALVSGAARRIGAVICQRLHQQGYRIVLHYGQSEKAASALAASLNAVRAHSVITVQADLLNHDDRERLIEQSISQWGRVDLLVNNASTFYSKSVDETTEAIWDDLMGSNLKAPFFLAQGLANTLKQHQGAIINIIDIHSQRPLKGYPVYSAAKAGLAMITQALAKELAPEVRVNGVSPGPILLPEGDNESATTNLMEKTPLQRMGCPDDIADTVIFLAKQTYITGQIIAVDGGKSLYS